MNNEIAFYISFGIAVIAAFLGGFILGYIVRRMEDENIRDHPTRGNDDQTQDQS